VGGRKMPTYEFKCLKCKNKFEITENITKYDPKKIKCPKCGEKKLERIYSGVYVQTSSKS
jgi:putative FmdB family regulatory protein